MGFWKHLDHVTDNLHKIKQTTARAAKQQVIIDPNAVGCDACTLRSVWGTIASPQMKISGNWNTGEILALAEAPGEQEDRDGAALVGPSGKLLRDNIPHKHNKRVAFQNVCRCRPPENRTPTPHEMHACSPYLEEDVANMPNLTAILGLGGTPLRKFYPDGSIMKAHGIKMPVSVGGRVLWYYPVFHPAFVIRENREAERRGRRESSAGVLFQSDLRRFFNGVDQWNPPRIEHVKLSDVVWAKSESEAQAIIDRMSDPVAVDLESSRLRPYEVRSELLTASVSDGKLTVAWSCNHPSMPTTWGTNLIIKVVRTRRWIAHNAAHELSWFRYLTSEPLMPFDDTMAYSRLIFERQGLLGLDDTSQLVLGVNIKSLSNIDAAQIMSYKLEDIIPYNGLDSWASARIHRRIGGQVAREDYTRILGAISATVNMELMGIPYDLNEAETMQAKLLSDQERIRADARNLYEVKQYEADRGIEFKITSAEQVGAALVAYGKLPLPKTDKGKQYATDEDTLSKFADENPLARAVLDDREIAKVVTYVDATIEAPKLYPDGMLHPTYTTMFTSTLRLSSREPNIQNYPVRKHPEIRRQIVAPKGNLFCKFDYGQLQMRIQGWASRDRALCKSIIEHVDMHTYWLDQVLHVYPIYLERLASQTGEKDEAKVRKAGRNVIKSDFVFSSLFGSNAETTCERTGIPLRQVQEVLGFFWETYKDVQVWQRDQYKIYRDYGVIRFMTGREWRGIAKGTEPVNYPIQGMEADIVMEAMDELSQLAMEYDDFYFHPRMQIHDDLSFFLPNANPEPYIEEIQKVMVRTRYQFQCVPLTVECKIGDNWCDTYDVHTFEGSYV